MTIALDSCQFCRNIFTNRHCCTNLSGDIISAKYLIDKDIVGSMLAIDMYEGVTTHIRHTGTTIHLTLWV